VDQKVVSTE